MTPAARTTAGLGIGLPVAGAVYALAGSTGLVVLTEVAALVVVAVAAVRAAELSRAQRSIAPPDDGGRRQWSSLYRLESAVMYGLQSQRLYDLSLRPRLQRAVETLVAERRGVDPAARPDVVRTIVGDQLWPLVDPARPASTDGRPGGLDVRSVERLVERIESV